MNKYRYVDEGRVHVHQLWSVLDNGEEAWKPLIGTSTMAKESVNKGDGLMMWYADLAALEALGRKMSLEDYEQLLADYETAEHISNHWEKSAAKKAIDAKYPDYAESRKAAIRKRDGSAKTGTDRHGELESYVRKCIESNDSKPLEHKTNMHEGIKAFVDWAFDKVDRFVFTEAHCLSEKLWLGGIADIGMVMKDGKRLIGDHKSGKVAYFEHFIQAALYDIQLAENGILDRDGNKLGEWQLADGIVIFPFRSEPFTPEYHYDMEGIRKVAENVVETYRYRVLKNFN